jgi:transcriptional regulator GlxA family with amidase domain
MSELIKQSHPPEPQADFARFFSFVMDQFDEEIQLPELAAAVNMSPWALCRQFQKKFGISPMRWVWRFRIMLAHECIQLVPDWQLTDISVLCGFSSLAHFSRQFRNLFGQSPSEFRQGLLAQNPDALGSHPELIFADLTTDHRDLLESVVRKSLALPQYAG